ncbi:transthyretin-like protein [Clostridium chromiireducens]|uniref:Transthyretin-like protein n=2 Tax=Clostridium chromiireducens TaxID=225345 RepID=A0A964RRB4_9CLOT|nr:transthyretin-like protein [Clostridium chromiireducens]
MENKELCGGVIEVTSILECEEHEYLKGIKINLYKINGLSPILIRSMTTDDKGKAVFLGIEDGCYRIIEIVDKKYFEKPKYINWNEIIIDSINKNQKIVIVNRVKKIIP